MSNYLKKLHVFLKQIAKTIWTRRRNRKDPHNDSEPDDKQENKTEPITYFVTHGRLCSLFREHTKKYALAVVLPEGWACRVTEGGCPYYASHIDKTTTWIHPTTGSSALVDWDGKECCVESFRKHSEALMGTQVLPEGWSCTVAPSGRLYYSSHVKQYNTWFHPITGDPSPVRFAILMTPPPIRSLETRKSVPFQIDDTQVQSGCKTNRKSELVKETKKLTASKNVSVKQLNFKGGAQSRTSRDEPRCSLCVWRAGKMAAAEVIIWPNGWDCHLTEDGTLYHVSDIEKTSTNHFL